MFLFRLLGSKSGLEVGGGIGAAGSMNSPVAGVTRVAGSKNGPIAGVTAGAGKSNSEVGGELTPGVSS